MSLEAAVTEKRTHVRYIILLIIFIVTAINYADRATLSIAGTEVAKELQLDAVAMGYIFSAFGWAYLLMQIPGVGCWTAMAPSGSTPIACSSGRYLPLRKGLSTCSR